MAIDDNVWKKFFDQPIDSAKQFGGTYQAPAIAGSGRIVFDDKVNPTPEEEEKRRIEHNLRRGSEVLSTIEAQETSYIGEAADNIHRILKRLQDSASLTNQQWKFFTELTHRIHDLIGEPNDPGPIDPNAPSCERT